MSAPGRVSPAAEEAFAVLSRRIASRGALLLWSHYGRPDYKRALELGAAIYLGRPILLAVPRGETAPFHLRRVAHSVIEGVDVWSEGGRAQVEEALDRLEAAALDAGRRAWE